MQTHSAEDQLKLWADRVEDSSKRVATGWQELDTLLYRGGVAPGELVILGGRTRTRKSTLVLNLAANMLGAGHAVSLVGLDESPANYVAKMMSVWSGMPHESIEESWLEGHTITLRESYMEKAKNFTLLEGQRPSLSELSQTLEMTQHKTGRRPEVVFIDYGSLLAREQYDGAEVQRITRMVEGVQVWTKAEKVCAFLVSQVGRADEWGTKRYHGDEPGTLEALKYGGEEMADVVLFTFRPALSPLGNMSRDQAEATEQDLDKWEFASTNVEKYRDSTFVQVLKNRPGTRVNHEGIELRSVGEGLKMRPTADMIDERMEQYVEAR